MRGPWGRRGRRRPVQNRRDGCPPFLLVDRDETPFHGEQYIALSLTTRTWHDERIPLDGEDWADGGAPESSSIIPWSVNAIRTEWIDYRQRTLREDVVAEAVAQRTEYVE